MKIKLPRRVSKHTIILIAALFALSSIYTLQRHLYFHLSNDNISLNSETEGAVRQKLSEKSSYEDFVEEDSIEEEANRRVVILAGPHKTGSTSIQNNFHKWTGPDQYLLQKWAWPVPSIVTKYEMQDENNSKWNPSKGFYALAEILRNPRRKNTKRVVFEEVSKVDLLGYYNNEFLKAWMMGYNLIIGSEAFDNVIKDEGDGVEIIDRLIRLLPWNYNLDDSDHSKNDKITVVVTYRVPRVKHLLSIWRETKQKGQSFQEWMSITRNKLGAIDSLGLTEIFLKKGLRVVIADIAGISNAGYEISNVIACDVLNATCTKEKHVDGSDPPFVLNTKVNFREEVNVTDDQLDLMDEAIRLYDCKYANMIEEYERSGQLTLIHPTELLDIMNSCNEKSKKGAERIKLKQQLVCITKNCTEVFM